MRFGIHPLPVSGRKFLFFYSLQMRYGAKFLSSLDLAADSSQEMTYGRFWSTLGLFVSHCGIDSRRELARRRAFSARIPASIVRRQRAIIGNVCLAFLDRRERHIGREIMDVEFLRLPRRKAKLIGRCLCADPGDGGQS